MTKRKMWSGAAVFCGLFLLVGQVQGQRPENPIERNNPLQKDREAGQQKQVCLASALKDMAVKDSNGKEVGKISDFVVSSKGEVKYLAVHLAEQSDTAPAEERGAARPPLGRPNAAQSQGKLTLIPWDVVGFHIADTPTQSYASVKIEGDRIEQAPSFTEAQLTSASNQQQWMSRVDQFFEQETRRGAARPDLNRDREDEDENEDRVIEPEPDEDE